MIVMERAKGFESRAGRAQTKTFPDDINDIVCFPDPFSQRGPIVDHGAPGGS